MATDQLIPQGDGLGNSRRPPMVFCYCRVSHKESAESGLGIASQIASFNTYWNAWCQTGKFKEGTIRGVGGWQGKWSSRSPDGRRIRTRVGQPRTDGVFVDLGISAYRRNLRLRPAGELLDKSLRKGDIVVFPRMDRAFRNMRDYANTSPDWQDRGIGILFINPDFDMTTAVGKLMIHQLAAMAEFESNIKSERTCEALLAAWRRGQPANSRKARVFGWRMAPGGVWVPYWQEREVLLRELIGGRQAGKSWPYIRCRVEEGMAAVENREVRPHMRYTPRYSYAEGGRSRQREVSEYSEKNLRAWFERWQKAKIPMRPSEAVA